MATSRLGDVLRLSAGVVVAVNAAGFAVTAATKSHKVTDLCGTSAFIASAWATHAVTARVAGRSPLAPCRGLLLTVAVTAWGARLSSYLFARVLRLGKDERLDFLFPATPDEPALTGPAAFPLKLAGFWLAQGAWAWVCLLPVTACHALAATTPMGPAAWAAAAAAAGCLWVEAEADTQKAAFRADPANAGTFLDTGLYSVVRYPNYAGEIGVWTFLTALAGSTTLTAAPWVVASPVGAAGLLLCVSGVPPLQKAHERRYGHLPAWRDYVEATPAILPRLPARWFGGRKEA